MNLHLDDWKSSKADFCARVARNQSPLKIVLKTKDDPYFLESWIQHHERIAGLHNLIIFDHMSSNDQVRLIYQKYQPDVPIVRFDGNHNAVHSTEQFAELYDCLRQSCQFFAFLDTDEFLVVFHDDASYACDERILEFLQAHDDTKVFPGTWLGNVEGSDRIFRAGESLSQLGAPMAWGKPIVRSSAGLRGYINHNIHVDGASLRGVVPSNLFVLHMMWLFPQQRIASNINALTTIGFASPGDGVEAILAKDIETVTSRGLRQHIRRLVTELRKLVTAGPVPAPHWTPPKGCLELGERGDIRYHGASERAAMHTFLTDAQPFIHAVLETDISELRTSSREHMRNKWEQSADRIRTGSIERAPADPDPAPRNARLLAFYLPQFYPIPENNRWWGKGFTEWTNVARARPLFAGHYQPHLPGSLGFYDLRLPDTRQAQADLARAHSIEGFCYWHYWFHGTRLLHRPFDEVLASGQPDFPFCLSWANETWSRRWHGTGAAHEVLQKQAYSPEDDLNHIRWLLKAFADPRYVTVNGRPLFLVYKPAELPDPQRMTDTFRSECVRHGLPEPFLLASNSHADHDYRRLGFDRTLEWEPQLGLLPGPNDPGLKRYDYADARQRMASRTRDFPTYPSIFVRWDNTPRRAESGIVFTDSTPERFEAGLTDVIRRVMHQPFDERLVLINAWNEWAEGNHLEPDLEYGTKYLEAVKRANAVSHVTAAVR